jgi:D-glycero-D-manno-heptose 1,7-bisphosphate phosphatase
VTPDSDRFVGTVFLDRDGTINRKAPENDYVKTVEEFVLLPTVIDAIRELNHARRRVIVATNQRGIALGRMTEDDLHEIHDHMSQLLAAGGATVDAIYHCPHDRASCECRKPRVGMFVRAARDHVGVSLDESAIFGDSERDMAAGTALGMTRVLVGTDVAAAEPVRARVDYRAQTLLEGVRWLLGRDREAAGADANRRKGEA